MNNFRALLILLIFSLCLAGCSLDILKHEYPDWTALMTAPENEKGWYPPLFNSSRENNLSDVVLFNDLDTNAVWGKFIYLNNVYNGLPVNDKRFILSSDFSEVSRLVKLGFNAKSIEFSFTEEGDYDRLWYYFVDTDKKTIYFCSARK